MEKSQRMPEAAQASGSDSPVLKFAIASFVGGLPTLGPSPTWNYNPETINADGL